MEVDVALVVLLAAGFLLGYLRGAIRQLIVVGAWLVVFLDSYYGAGPGGLPPGTTELDLARQLNQAFDRSAIVGFMHDSLIPGLMALLGPLLPADIRAVYA